MRSQKILQMHVVRLHTFAKHAERKKKIPHGRKRKTITYTFLLIAACFCCYLKTSGLIKYPACRIGYKSSQANHKILNKLDSNLDSNLRTRNLMFDPPTLWKTKAKHV